MYKNRVFHLKKIEIRDEPKLLDPSWLHPALPIHNAVSSLTLTVTEGYVTKLLK